VYLETSVIGYLASRPSADLVTAGNQRLTLDWWTNHRSSFELFASQAVIAECSEGDPTAADQRLAFLDEIPVLEITDDARLLAKTLLTKVPMPPKAEVDALHIAVAAMNAIDYLLTWNCKHLANPSLRRIIDGVVIAADVNPPTDHLHSPGIDQCMKIRLLPKRANSGMSTRGDSITISTPYVGICASSKRRVAAGSYNDHRNVLSMQALNVPQTRHNKTCTGPRLAIGTSARSLVLTLFACPRVTRIGPRAR
jgi:hypothetical protein